MPEKERKVSTGLYLKQSTYDKIKSLADRDGRSFNNYVNIILEKFLSKRGEQKVRLVKKKGAA